MTIFRFNEFTSEAVAAFIRFIYCFELDEMPEKLSLDVLKELARIGDMCLINGLKEAANRCISKMMTTGNVFEILEFKMKYQSDKLDECAYFIAGNFEKNWLKDNGILKKYPVIAVTILERLIDWNINPRDATSSFQSRYNDVKYK